MGMTVLQFDDSIFTQLNLRPKEMFNQMQQNDRSGTWLYNCGTKKYWCSNQTYRIYGLKRHTELIPDLFMKQVCKKDAEQAKAAFAAVLTGKPYRFIHRIKINGALKWLEQSGRMYPGKKSSPPYVLGTVRDVTKIKRQEESLETKRANLDAIAEYLAQTTNATGLSEIVTILKDTIHKRINALMVSVFISQEEQIARAVPMEIDPVQAFFFQDICDFIGYKAIELGQRQECSVGDYPNRLGKELLEDLGARHVTALPIKHGKTVIGSLSVVTKRPGGLNHEENEFVRTICSYFSNQINNTLLYDRLKQELEISKRLESDRDVIFNESVDFISIIDNDGCFAQINPAFANRLGFASEDLVGRSVFDFIHPEDRSHARGVFNSLPNIGVFRGFRNRFLCKNGEIGYLENNLKYMAESGKTIAIARDLTGRKEMENRNVLLEQKVVFERSKSELIAGLSHEFKTPLNIILSSLDLIRLKSCKENEKRFQNEYEKFFNYAYQNCYKLLRLSSNLLDSDKMENEFYRLHITKVQLYCLLQRIVDAAVIYANAKKVELFLHSQADEKAWIACDEDSVERILLNLLSNSIKNSREGGEIHVTLEEQPDFFLIKVEDNGVGIPQEVLPQIFDKFITGQNMASGHREGSGIGLSLVKLLTELHGGTVSVESELGIGSRFSFTLSKHQQVTGKSEQLPSDGVSALTRLELADAT